MNTKMEEIAEKKQQLEDQIKMNMENDDLSDDLQKKL